MEREFHPVGAGIASASRSAARASRCSWFPASAAAPTCGCRSCSTSRIGGSSASTRRARDARARRCIPCPSRRWRRSRPPCSTTAASSAPTSSASRTAAPIAQQLAYDHPERVRRLVLAATNCGWGSFWGSPEAMAVMATPMRFYSASYFERVAADVYGGVTGRDAAKRQGAIGARRRLPPSSYGYAMQLLGGIGWSSWGFLPDIPHETLVICGDDDPLVPVANAQMLAERIPRADARRRRARRALAAVGRAGAHRAADRAVRRLGLSALAEGSRHAWHEDRSRRRRRRGRRAAGIALGQADNWYPSRWGAADQRGAANRITAGQGARSEEPDHARHRLPARPRL